LHAWDFRLKVSKKKKIIVSDVAADPTQPRNYSQAKPDCQQKVNEIIFATAPHGIE